MSLGQHPSPLPGTFTVSTKSTFQIFNFFAQFGEELYLRRTNSKQKKPPHHFWAKKEGNESGKSKSSTSTLMAHVLNFHFLTQFGG